jgi:hypothetical protein
VSEARNPRDHDWLYATGAHDPDGHRPSAEGQTWARNRVARQATPTTNIPRAVRAALRRAAAVRVHIQILTQELDAIGATLMELDEAVVQSEHGHSRTHPNRDRQPGPAQRPTPQATPRASQEIPRRWPPYTSTR